MSDVVGIDLGLKSIKVVALNGTREALVLAAVGEIKTPSVEWMKAEANKKSIEEVANAVKSLIKDLKTLT